jgi:hypothetical protein
MLVCLVITFTAEPGRGKANHGHDEGTGSVLDAVRIGVPVIVVPNTELLDNHQLEFAEQMAKMDYAIHGDIKCANLYTARSWI